MRDGLIALSGASLAPRLVSGAPALPVAPVQFKLKETAGLQRFSYPVHAVVPIAADASKLRLELDGKPVPAQFRNVVDAGGKVLVRLDFVSSLPPLKSQTYTVRQGDPVEPKGSLKVVEKEDAYLVSSGNSLRYTIPRNLNNLSASVENASLEFIGDVKHSLALGARTLTGNGRLAEFGASRSSITRQGPFAIGLKFEGDLEAGAGKKLASVVELTFPSSKSWIEAVWMVDDPEGLVTDLTFKLPLKVEGSPTLLDFGATNTVYGTIKGDEVMVLLAGREPVQPSPNPGASWIVFRGTPGKGVPQFACSTSPDGPLPEGWAHVMDRKRCTAVSVDAFGRASRDSLSVSAKGDVEFYRSYVGNPASTRASLKGVKSLRYWAHFVTNPVQIGAVTSPQAMLAPLVVEW
ncbi:MAG: hypothetical protein U0835_26985 [Isosphaeraceae bacterium]